MYCKQWSDPPKNETIYGSADKPIVACPYHVFGLILEIYWWVSLGNESTRLGMNLHFCRVSGLNCEGMGISCLIRYYCCTHRIKYKVEKYYHSLAKNTHFIALPFDATQHPRRLLLNRLAVKFVCWGGRVGLIAKQKTTGHLPQCSVPGASTLSGTSRPCVCTV